MPSATDLSAVLQQFSCPQELWNESVSSVIVSTSYRRMAAHFLERYRGELSSRSVGLVDLLDEFVNGELPGDSETSSEIGAMGRAAQFGSVDPVRIAAAFALYRRTGNDWSASLQETSRLKLNGWLLPPARRVVLNRGETGTTLSLTSPDGVVISCVADNSVGRLAGCEHLTQTGRQRQIALLPEAAVPSDLLKICQELGHECVSEICPMVASYFDEALQLLAAYVPQYSQWVERVVTEIIVTKCPSNVSQSGSWREAPGTLQVSWSTDPVTVAEALVHEASHQYAYQVYRVSPLDNGSDTQLYFSPAAKRERPIERILFAYHAFANIVLFYEELLTAGMPASDSVIARVKKCRRNVEDLYIPLQNSRALTPAGHALLEPLSFRVRAQAVTPT